MMTHGLSMKPLNTASRKSRVFICLGHYSLVLLASEHDVVEYSALL